MSSPITWTALETASAIRGKKISVKEVVAAHLDRAHGLNPSLNALTDIDDDAIARAEAMDNAHPGASADLLWGVPVTTKINIDQKGFVNSNGVPAMKENRCDHDSPLVTNLKDSGAVIIGRTNTPEFSMRWSTSNPIHGVSNNPWRDDITPGGSSGGAASAVAAGIGAIAHGNDLGGSLRYPAYCCGIASIRPSMGVVPAYNPDAKTQRPAITQSMSVQGPIARNIADLRLGLKVMSRRSSHDPIWSNADDADYRQKPKAKIGFSLKPFVTVDTHPDVIDAMKIAIQGLRDAGHDMVEMPFANADRAADLWGELLFTEGKALLAETVYAHGSENMINLFHAYGAYFKNYSSIQELLMAMGERLNLQRQAHEMFDDIDAFLMPTSLIPPTENDADFKYPNRINDLIDAQKPLFLVALLGIPAVALPTHIKDNIPQGVQLIGPSRSDRFMLDLAESLETEIGVFTPPI